MIVHGLALLALVLRAGPAAGQSIPDAWIHDAGQRAKLAFISSCWHDDDGTGVCGDAIFRPSELTGPVVRSEPGALWSLELERSPTRASLYLWIRRQDVTLSGGTFRAPQAPGTHVYRYCARWENGDACYGFILDVQGSASARQASATLDALLTELRTRVPMGSRQRELDAVQARWTEYREATCHWEASLFDGGTVARDVFEHCMARVTRDRIDQLKPLLCEGWGTTGECDASRRYDEGPPVATPDPGAGAPEGCMDPEVVPRGLYSATRDLDCDGPMERIRVAMVPYPDGRGLEVQVVDSVGTRSLPLEHNFSAELVGFGDLDGNGIRDIVMAGRDVGMVYPVVVLVERDRLVAASFQSQEMARAASYRFDEGRDPVCVAAWLPRLLVRDGRPLLSLAWGMRPDPECEGAARRLFRVDGAVIRPADDPAR